MTQTVEASPTKEFFVNMITRDITLEDCVLDLLDNSVDGARSYIARKRPIVGNGDGQVAENLDGFFANISLSEEKFLIEDNCGGISIDNAKHYAFHFGRRKDAPPITEGNIGLYGIGMKRAVLKMGEDIEIFSSTDDEAFIMNINVNEWLQKEEWDFILEEDEPWDFPGTKIQVTNLYQHISDEFEDNSFQSRLRTIIARDYSFLLKSGFKVSLNNNSIEPYLFQLRESDAIKPVKISYEDPIGVKVEIYAGMAAEPPEDVSAEEMESRERRETQNYGWYVICNNRVVLAADRTDRTIWGDEGFPKWHFQFNGFIGFVKFTSDDPLKLPWTTTKREVDESSPVYRRAVVRMKDATRPWINYTTDRKRDLKRAKEFERVAVPKPIEEVIPQAQMVLPIIDKEPKIKMATISYQKPVDEVNKVKDTLGNPNLRNSEVGRLTFEYYVESEVVD